MDKLTSNKMDRPWDDDPFAQFDIEEEPAVEMTDKEVFLAAVESITNTTLKDLQDLRTILESD